MAEQVAWSDAPCFNEGDTALLKVTFRNADDDPTDPQDSIELRVLNAAGVNHVTVLESNIASLVTLERPDGNPPGEFFYRMAIVRSGTDDSCEERWRFRYAAVSTDDDKPTTVIKGKFRVAPEEFDV